MTYPFVQGISFGRRKGPVKAFVIHMAEGGGTVSYLKDDATPPARNVSVHYVIEYTGRTVQMLREADASGSINPQDLRTTNGPEPFGRTPRVAVMGEWDYDPNSAVISVEIEGYAKDGPNAKQAAALQALVADVRSRYPDIGLLGHRDFQDYKACPGAHIDWDALGGHGPAAGEDSMVIPQRLNHVVVSRDNAHMFREPDVTSELPTVIPKGNVLRKFGGVTGWAFVQINGYGDPPGPVYAWMKSYDLTPHDQPLTVIDGTCPPPTDCTAAVAAAVLPLNQRIATLETDAGTQQALQDAVANDLLNQAKRLTQ